MGLRMVGTIKIFPTDMEGKRKGYGFLNGEDDVDRFFHISDCASGSEFDDMGQGDSVEFEHIDGDRGPRAINVSVR